MFAKSQKMVKILRTLFVTWNYILSIITDQSSHISISEKGRVYQPQYQISGLGQ